MSTFRLGGGNVVTRRCCLCGETLRRRRGWGVYPLVTHSTQPLVQLYLCQPCVAPLLDKARKLGVLS